MVYKPRENTRNSTLTIGPRSEYQPTSGVGPGSVAPLYGQKPTTDFKQQKFQKQISDIDEKNLGQGQRQARHDDNVDTAIGVAGALLAPEVRIQRLIPYAEKLGTKFMTKFAGLLSKTKGDGKAITKIAEKIERSPGFESWRIKEAPAHAKRNERYASKPAYEKKAIANRSVPDLIDTEGNNRGKPDWYVKDYKASGKAKLTQKEKDMAEAYPDNGPDMGDTDTPGWNSYPHGSKVKPLAPKYPSSEDVADYYQNGLDYGF